MLEADGLAYRFRHEMVREVLQQSLSPARRRFLIERAGLARAALEQRVPPRHRHRTSRRTWSKAAIPSIQDFIRQIQ
jgi:hypothetical protein